MDFVALFDRLDQTTKTSLKVEAIFTYLNEAVEKDKIFVISLLIGHRPKRPVKTSDLRIWAAEAAHIPLWLLEESYYIVGDLAETLSLVLPDVDKSNLFEISELYIEITNLIMLDSESQKRMVMDYWKKFSGTSRFLFNKLLTGNFRVGVSKKIVVKALASYVGLAEAVVEHRLMGKWSPLTESLESLFAEKAVAKKHFLPFPFLLAYPLTEGLPSLGNVSEWLIEPKLDGIRGQIILRQGDIFIWSRGEELMTEKFPEFKSLLTILPEGTVLDGEIIPWRDDAPMDFSLMQTRIGRKNLSAKLLQEVPLIMVCFDLLEWHSQDVRSLNLAERRALLEQIFHEYPVGPYLKLSEKLEFTDLNSMESYRLDARLYHAEGLMIKNLNSAYGVGRRRGDWWKFKTDPMSIDAVLLYAQSGHGRRANLYTDYTFAVWDGDQLVPFAKAYSGLTDKELFQIDNWIKRNTLEKFGPVRSVKAELIFEIAFEGINLSPRHKSGIAVRFPRILRWRKDKSLNDINSKQDLLQLIESKR